MQIRPATEADAAAIARLSRDLAAHIEDPDPGPDTGAILSAGFGPDRWFQALVAEAGGEVAGFALYCRRFEAHTRMRRLWLADLVVAPTQRRRGICAALVAALRAEAHRLGCDGIVLELWRQNDSARAFYEALGGVVQDEIEVVGLGLG